MPHRQSIKTNSEIRSLLAYSLIVVSKLLYDILIFDVTTFSARQETYQTEATGTDSCAAIGLARGSVLNLKNV